MEATSQIRSCGTGSSWSVTIRSSESVAMAAARSGSRYDPAYLPLGKSKTSTILLRSGVAPSNTTNARFVVAATAEAPRTAFGSTRVTAAFYKPGIETAVVMERGKEICSGPSHCFLTVPFASNTGIRRKAECHRRSWRAVLCLPAIVCCRPARVAVPR